MLDLRGPCAEFSAILREQSVGPEASARVVVGVDGAE